MRRAQGTPGSLKAEVNWTERLGSAKLNLQEAGYVFIILANPNIGTLFPSHLPCPQGERKLRVPGHPFMPIFHFLGHALMKIFINSFSVGFYLC